jgi:hypothetical protein
MMPISSPTMFHIARRRPKRSPAAMQEIAPAPGDKLMSQDAAKKASQVSSVMVQEIL